MAGRDPEAQTGPGTIPVFPGDPLVTLAADYAAAEVTVVYERIDKARRLLLAVVELLPELLERAPEGTHSEKLPDGVELNVTRWHVSALDAITLYRHCREGSIQLPPFMDPRGRAHDIVVPVERCDDEPAWPGFVLEEQAFWGSTPFWGDRLGGTRWHRQIPAQASRIWERWTSTQRDRAAKWLRSQLSLDLTARPVLWGSVHLRLPNPVFSELDQTLSTDGRKIALRFTPHPGKDVSDLQVTLREQRPGGTTYSYTTAAREFMVLEVPWPPSRTGLEVRCPRRGLLYSSPSSTFIQSIQLGILLLTRERRVVVPSRSKKREADEFVVSVGTEPEQRSVGSPAQVQPALARLALDEDSFRTQQRGEELGLRWFRNQRAEAGAFVRSLIGQAQSSVYIVDPYFDAYTVRAFAVATQMARLPVRVLTSAMHLKERLGGKEHGEILLAELNAVLEQDPSLNIEVRVARGDESPIHDRFLVVDDAIWQPGSSLYDFGTNGSTIIKLPHPLIVRLPIEAAWTDAPTLATFVAERRAAPRPKLSLAERFSVLKKAIVTAWRGL